LPIKGTVPLHARDVLKVIVALQTKVTNPLAGTAGQVVAGASGRLQDTAVMVVHFAKQGTAPAYASLQQARQAVQAAAAVLAAQGPGTALSALGTAQGVTVPVYAQSVDGIQNVKKILQSSGIEATVKQTAASVWPAATSETLTLVSSIPGGGFGIHAGSAASDAGRFKWTLNANVHGQALQGGGDELGFPTAGLPLACGRSQPCWCRGGGFPGGCRRGWCLHAHLHCGIQWPRHVGVRCGFWHRVGRIPRAAHQGPRGRHRHSRWIGHQATPGHRQRPRNHL
jgi:hypothetical protein